MVDPTPRIGQEIRRIRTEQQLTLDETANRSGVSKAMLGQIERGESNPTIATLWKIASGLRVSLSSLLSYAEDEYQVVDIKALPFVQSSDQKMKLYDIFPFNPISGFEYFYITLEPGASHASQAHENSSGEYIVVTEGELTLVIDERKYVLNAPAAIQFSPQKNHRYENHSTSPTVFQNIVRY